MKSAKKLKKKMSKKEFGSAFSPFSKNRDLPTVEEINKSILNQTKSTEKKKRELEDDLNSSKLRKLEDSLSIEKRNKNDLGKIKIQ